MVRLSIANPKFVLSFVRNRKEANYNKNERERTQINETEKYKRARYEITEQ